MIKIIIR